MQNILVQVIRLGGIAVVARLLEKEDFGIYGVALLCFGFLIVFMDAGFSSALIQRKGLTKNQMHTAWAVEVTRYVLAGILLYLAAPLLADFFNEPKATEIIEAIGIVTLFGGLSSVSMAYLQKEMRFDRIFYIHVGSNSLDIIGMIIVAVYWPSVWALVAGYAIKTLTLNASALAFGGYRPRLSFSLKEAKSLFNFGKWIFSSNVLLFFLNRGDNIVVGKFFGSVALGVYQMAFRISELSTSHINRMAGKVLFPSYSKIQDDINALRRSYAQAFQFVTSVCGFLAFFFVCFADVIVRIVLGEGWEDAVALVAILSVWAYIRSVSNTTGPLFAAAGKPKLSTYAIILRGVLFWVFIPLLGYHYEVIGIAAAPVLAGAISMFYYLYNVKQILKTDWYFVLIPPLMPPLAFFGAYGLITLAGFNLTFISFTDELIKVALFSLAFGGIMLLLDYLLPRSMMLQSYLKILRSFRRTA